MSEPTHPVYTVQIVIDSQHPHSLADWWAAAIGWQVEPQDEGFIRRIIEQGFATEDDTLRHQGKLMWAAGSAIRHPDDQAGAPRILFQAVPEPKTVKNRVHLDLRTDQQPSSEEVDRLLAAGASRYGGGQQGPLSWVTLTDPEGNEFCLPTPSR